MLHPCKIETMHIIIFLLGFGQRLMPNVKHSGMDTTGICTIMSKHFIIKEIPTLLPRTMLVPNRRELKWDANPIAFGKFKAERSEYTHHRVIPHHHSPTWYRGVEGVKKRRVVTWLQSTLCAHSLGQTNCDQAPFLYSFSHNLQ